MKLESSLRATKDNSHNKALSVLGDEVLTSVDTRSLDIGVLKTNSNLWLKHQRVDVVWD